ncbi:hypothetical protein [Polaromonas sp. YR568]|uniref:hypothetical protein n=1 Tax=Polaromonas sp. YR568 TaxID=1855301 RepID=UPI00398C1BE9
MPPSFPLQPGPLAVRVKEPSAGLFYWVVTQLSADERMADLRIEASDHPYPTHEAALHAGAACLKELKASVFQPQGPH